MSVFSKVFCKSCSYTARSGWLAVTPALSPMEFSSYLHFLLGEGVVDDVGDDCNRRNEDDEDDEDDGEFNG